MTEALDNIARRNFVVRLARTVDKLERMGGSEMGLLPELYAVRYHSAVSRLRSLLTDITKLNQAEPPTRP